MYLYDELRPQLADWLDEMVLVNAWRKMSDYVRRYNWYVDLLELDCSAIQLKQRIDQWREQLQATTYIPDHLQRVLAPKSQQWHFPEGEGRQWKPLDSAAHRDSLLRPLAHVSIRDQTVMTALMLCFANVVETAQGKTMTADFQDAQRQRVYSYGNRLQCYWTDDGRAQIPWVGTACYRQYYDDYKAFLQRPQQVCRHYTAHIAAEQELYVVSLDIAQFFARIHRPLLLEKLRQLVPRETTDERFWQRCAEAMNWQFVDDEAEVGLPQGLVASGFFANAYLLSFDEALGRQLQPVTNDIAVLDYCRYVDDLRLVVAAPKAMAMGDIERFAEQFVERTLLEETKTLHLNKEKTYVVPYRQLMLEGSMSTTMTAIQNRISGTLDVESVHQLIGELGSLLHATSTMHHPLQRGNALALSNISRQQLDIHEDTLKRFSAIRLVRTLKLKKSMQWQEDERLDHEFETTARRLVACWAENPSLTLLLQCAFELYPAPDILQPVLEALSLHLFAETTELAYTVSCYVAADILRRMSVQREASAVPTSFQLLLRDFALKLLAGTFPWYVQQQAAYFLLSAQLAPLSLPNIPELSMYHRWQHVLNYETMTAHWTEWLPLALIVQRQRQDWPAFNQWFMTQLQDEKLKKTEREAALLQLLQYEATWLPKVALHREFRQLAVRKVFMKQLDHYVYADYDRGDWPNQQWIPLIQLIQSKHNPFRYENALLLLAAALLVEPKTKQQLLTDHSLHNLLVSCENWQAVQNPFASERFLQVKWQHVNQRDVLFATPPSIEEEHRWLYRFGMIIRSSFIGASDFTQQGEVLHTTPYIRQLSFVHYRAHGHLPNTPWLSELLHRLLQGPSTRMATEQPLTWEALQQLIQQRMIEQQRIYGKLSQTPLYKIPVRARSGKSSTTLRFALAQTILPQEHDFNSADPTLWTDEMRKRQRNHLAAVCHLIHKQVLATLEAREQVDDFDGIDFIIFPELAVHCDDIPLLERLSDQTKAHILVGLMFHRLQADEAPINRALWLLRDEQPEGRQFIHVYQGKQHMTKTEQKLGIQPHRPYQAVIEWQGKQSICLAGAICYDATDLSLAADLRDVSDVFIIPALNRDIQTFDNMIAYLHYHMYQPVLLVNTGEYGGSSLQAPFARNQRTISHVHGSQQIAVSICEIDPTLFKAGGTVGIKTPPAGFISRT